MAQERITIALAGNPNSGKTSMFNALTGARQHVGNYPGVTVEKKWGQAHLNGMSVEVVDLPGTYSLTAYSLEERVARNFIIEERPDVVVDVVDAANLERNLYLAVQFMELGVPLVIALNMMDVAQDRGLVIDAAKLSGLLGVPVVPCVARSNKGMKEVLKAAVELAQGNRPWRPLEISYGHDVDAALLELVAGLNKQGQKYAPLSPRWMALKLLENDSEVLQQVDEKTVAAELEPLRQRLSQHLRNTFDDDPEGLIADYRYGFIGGIYRQAVRETRMQRLEVSDKVDRILTNRLLGPLILLAVIYGVYTFVFWASETPVAWLEDFFSWLGGAAEALIPEGLLQSLVVSGMIDGVGGVLGFVPLIMFMFFAIAILEDTGYLARVAYLLDRVLRGFGLHGNSIMAMIVSGGISGGCAVPGVHGHPHPARPQGPPGHHPYGAHDELRGQDAGLRPFDRGLFRGPRGPGDVRPNPDLLGLGPGGGQDSALDRFKGRDFTFRHGTASLPPAHPERAFDPHLGADLAVHQKGRHRDPGHQHPHVGHDDLPRSARGKGRPMGIKNSGRGHRGGQAKTRIQDGTGKIGQLRGWPDGTRHKRGHRALGV